MRNCFFLHNPKAGGTALRQALVSGFEPHEVCPLLELRPDVYGPQEKALPRGYGLYVGHYGMTSAQAVREGHALISNFRHPVARVVSLYRYFQMSVQDDEAVRSEPVYHAVRLAKRVRLPEFVASRDPRVTTFIADHHFRQLADCGWNLDATWPDVDSLISRLDWLYVCEFPDLSLRWGRRVLEAPELSVGRQNASREGSSSRADHPGLDEASYRRILELNGRDLALYEAAVSRLLHETAHRPSPASPPERAHARVAAVRSLDAPRVTPSPSRPPARGKFRVAGATAAGLSIVGALALMLLSEERANAARMPHEEPASRADIIDLEAHLNNPDAVLSRADLIAFTRFEATHPSAATKALRSRLAGRRFRVELPLGCGEQPAPHPTASARWWYASGRLGARITPSEWMPRNASSTPAPALFWITPSSNNAARCPDGFRDVEPGASVSGARVGLVAAGDPDRFAPLAQPAEIAAEEHELGRLVLQLRLTMEGTIIVPPGAWASTCRPLASGATADCVLYMRPRRVALTLAGDHPAVLSGWTQS